MSVPPEKVNQPVSNNARVAPFHFDAQGQQVHTWNLTPSCITGPVYCHRGPQHILPVIFVPGIMGSNLVSNDGNKTPVWRLDTVPVLGPVGVAWNMSRKNAGDRQKLLHPGRVEVDRDGAVPSEKAGSVARVTYIGNDGKPANEYTGRGWGEVAEGSYHAFLLWLERTLNGQGWDPMAWTDYGLREAVVGPVLQPGETPKPYPPHVRMGVLGMPEGRAGRGTHEAPLFFGDLQARANYLMPVYACGYNWLDSNEAAAQLLASRIGEIRKRYGDRCAQVLVVTHSMGGLVARRCQQLKGMADQIAGIVHGVMPATGAAVAYRRCKIGMADEISGIMGSIGSLVIGNNGREVTAVFAQAPGALQLLPSGDYPAGWLRLTDDNGKPAMPPLPTGNDPYTDIYLRKDRWWGLVREAWLAPEGGAPITWNKFTDNVDRARKFHAVIQNVYHPHTYVYYGADDKQPSFTNITWRMRSGLAPDGRPRPDAASAAELGMDGVRDDGSNPAYIGGSTQMRSSGGRMWGEPGMTTYNTSYWELHCDRQDSAGDGTVPLCSGRSPLAVDKQGFVHDQFQLTGFDHEGSYKNEGAQRVTLYALTKLAAAARKPA
jgi:hypothetical protein